MRELKLMMFAVMLVFIIIQFIRPVRNINKQMLPADFAKIYAVPENIRIVLQNACYDCHSNNTRYPWYSNIQPLAWIMGAHIKKGKGKLNFSEFGNYNNRRQISKLKGIANSLKDETMPLTSYKIMHKSARLSQTDLSFVIKWMEDKADSLFANYH